MRACVNNPCTRAFTSHSDDDQSSRVVSINAPASHVSYHGELLIENFLKGATVALAFDVHDLTKAMLY